VGLLGGNGGRSVADREADFRALFDANHQAMLGYSLRRTANAQDAVELLSDIMLVAWRRIDDVPAGEAGRLWLYGVARNMLANQRRAERRRSRLVERLAADIDSAVDDMTQSIADTLWVRSAMARLGDDDREVLTLTLWEGLAPREVAVVLGIPAATLRTRLHRARSRMRVELKGITGERTGLVGQERGDGCSPVRDSEEVK
jgi:RNA polymerase sigma factor (sigma-70 family)